MDSWRSSQKQMIHIGVQNESSCYNPTMTGRIGKLWFSRSTTHFPSSTLWHWFWQITANSRRKWSTQRSPWTTSTRRWTTWRWPWSMYTRSGLGIWTGIFFVWFLSDGRNPVTRICGAIINCLYRLRLLVELYLPLSCSNIFFAFSEGIISIPSIIGDGCFVSCESLGFRDFQLSFQLSYYCCHGFFLGLDDTSPSSMS